MNLAWLPKVDKMLVQLEAEMPESYCRPLLVAAVREAVDTLRTQALDKQIEIKDKEAGLAAGMALAHLLYERKNQPSLRRVLNATGVVLHTNLGRAVLAAEAVSAITEVAQGYCNLEMDLASGKRSSRYDHVVELLCLLSGAEDALVVNNNAAAVLLALDTLAVGGEAVVSRGELVEIGGSFRIPSIMEKTGVVMRDVGCTNKTHLRDYAEAINDSTKILLKVHPSNFRLEGFTAEVELDELVQLGHEHGLPVLDDLGSGCVFPLAEQGVGREPLVAQAIKSGVDVLTFSGDKLLGGPQAGIIVGKKTYIERMKANNLTRALRIDKFTLAALEATLRLYLDLPQAQRQIPTLSMILAEPQQLQPRAEALAAALQRSGLCRVEILPGMSAVGGGSLPGVDLPSLLVQVEPLCGDAVDLLQRLRCGSPAVLAYIREDKAVFDPRTFTDEELPVLIQRTLDCLEQMRHA